MTKLDLTFRSTIIEIDKPTAYSLEKIARIYLQSLE